MTPPADRRLTPRRTPHASDPVARLRLRAGRELTVVNVAAGGALVETEGRLLPGTHVDVHVMTPNGRELVRSRIVRAFVWQLSGERIVYRGALAFERHVEITVGYPIPRARDAEPAESGSNYSLEHV